MFNYFNLSDTKDYEYLLSAMGTDVLLNGSSVRALITNTNLNKDYDDKRISTLSQLKRGDLLQYEGKIFMVISEESSKRYNKYKAIMRQLPYSIIFNSACQFFDVNCYIEARSFSVSNGQVLSTPDGTIDVYLSQSTINFDLKINDKFIKFGQKFKVVGVDKMSKPGMVILTCDKDLIDPASDDLVNEIAGGLLCSVSVTNTEPVEVYEDGTLQLTWTATNGFPVVFSSSDNTIASVDANGLVTGHQLGTVTITVSNASSPAIMDTVTVTVVSVPVSYNVTITSASSTPAEIKNNQSKTYSAEVRNGSTLITDGSQPVNWSIWADDQVSTTTLATITTQSGTSCTVKNNAASSGYVQLKCTLQSDPNIYSWYRIQMKPLF